MEEFKDITIVGIDKEHVSVPTGGGGAGSGLYTVPFILSELPDPLWDLCFTKRQGRHTRLVGIRIYQDQTTMESVKSSVLAQLKDAVSKTNVEWRNEMDLAEKRAAEKEQQQLAHRKHVEEIADSLDFN